MTDYALVVVVVVVELDGPLSHLHLRGQISVIGRGHALLQRLGWWR